MLKVKNKFVCENELLSSLSNETRFLTDERISRNAEKIINQCRKNKTDRTKLDAFLNEYGLENNEGVAVMCMEEYV